MKPPVIGYRSIEPPTPKLPAGSTVPADPLKLAIGLSVMLLLVVVLVALAMADMILGY